MRSTRRSWAIGLVVSAAAAFAAVAAFATAGEASQGATALVPPSNTAPPQISGNIERGSTLTTTNGSWSGTAPITFSYQWLRCNANGAGCSNIGGATESSYLLRAADVGRTLRVRVTARNNDGSAQATSAPTGVIQQPAPQQPQGCAGNAPIQVSAIAPPERLNVDGQQISPAIVGRSPDQITLRFHVSCRGKAVQGALVYATAVPFNQFTVPAEQATGADGWATVTMNRLRGYPATPSQQLLVVFVRARKQGEDQLGGISTRRLVSFPVDLSR